MSFYLDASVIVPLVMPERSSTAILAFVTGQELSVSDYAVAETSSAVSRLVRMGEIGWAVAASALSDLDAWRARTAMNIGVVGPDIRLADIFVRRFDLKLRTPDALHVAICLRLGDILVTLDRRLAHAAGALGVRTVSPDF